MIKAFYYIRVFFISCELMFLAGCYAVFLLFRGPLESQFSSLTLNDDAVSWITLFPAGIAVWTLKEGVGVLFPDERTAKILHEWPEYWKLKTHFDIGVFNCIFFLIPCVSVWLLGRLNEFDGAWVFFSFSGAISINAFSFYAAKISVKSAVIRLNEDKF